MASALAATILLTLMALAALAFTGSTGTDTRLSDDDNSVGSIHQHEGSQAITIGEDAVAIIATKALAMSVSNTGAK